MEHVVNAPERVHIAELRALNRGRVAETLPILCFEDPAENPDLVRGYLHVDFMSVFVARRGKGLHVVDGVAFEVSAGDVYAMGYGMSHRFDQSEGLVLDAVHFLPSLFSHETQQALSEMEGLAPMFLGCEGTGSSRWLRLSKAGHAQAVDMLLEMREEWQANTPDRALMVQALFLRFLVFLARCNREAQRPGYRVGARARAIIDNRYAEPLKIGDLASSAFLSMGRFTEVFREEVGCSPREYLSLVRLRAAKNLLLETDLTVATIGARTGFPDPAYFARFFRQQVGVSPTEYREARTDSQPNDD